MLYERMVLSLGGHDTMGDKIYERKSYRLCGQSRTGGC